MKKDFSLFIPHPSSLIPSDEGGSPLDKSATPDRDPVAQPAVNAAENIPPTPPSPSAPPPAAPPAPGPEETPPEVPLTPMGWLAQNAIYLVLLAALVIWIVSSFGWEGLPSAALTILGIG